MISTFLQGGLGNYMFQISVAYSLSLDFNFECSFISDNAIKVHKNINEYKKNIFKNVSFIDHHNFLNIYNEPFFGYNKINIVDNTLLVGYFQSEKYILHNRDEIIKLFQPSENDLKYIEKKYGDILKNNNCSIHVRRGDYIKVQNHHPLCEKTYYEESIKNFNNDTTYIIFSDDINWCKENLHIKNSYYVENENDYIEMYLMSMCDNNIIANSSFSWWGAWLNQKSNKKVIAPKKWFGPAKGNIITKDIYAEKWLVI